MVEDVVKSRIILIISVLCLIFFFWAIGAHSEIGKHKKNLTDELRKRIEVEEQNANFGKERSALEGNIKQLTAQLEEEKAAHQATKKALVQEQSASSSAREELEKVTLFKDKIENDLQDALKKEKDSQKQIKK